MAITYPLALPTSIGIGSVDIRAVNAVTTSQSPFTYKQQVVSHTGQRWEASISLPRGRRDLLAPWKAFLTSLKGQTGTFLLGDPDYATPQGTALSFKKNLLTYSEQFDNAAWGKNNVTVTPNAITAPDGNLTADKVVENTGTGTHAVYEVISSQPLTTHSISCYFKAAERNVVRLRLGDDASPSSFINDIIVDLSDGSILNSADGALVEGAGDGWWRLSFYGATRADTSVVTFTAQIVDGLGDVDYTGDGTSGIYIWGAQIEEDSVATEYQPITDSYGPFVNGASQTGDTLNIKGASPSESSYLKAGDYIQLGSASSAKLYQVLLDVDTDESGNATVDIWPDLRSSPADGSSITISNPKGVFRLKENITSWSIDNTSNYGITFEAVEAIT